MDLEAVIFDYDGTLINTEQMYYDVISVLVEKHTGHKMDKQDYINNVSGTSVEQCKHYLTTTFNISEEDYKILNEEIVYEMTSNLHKAEVLPGIEETFALLKNNGIKIGVASNGSLGHIVDGLKTHNLYNYVDDIVTKYDVDRGKPHPDIYLFAAERLGVEIENCIAVEDSRNGALAAAASGAYLILQTNSITKYLKFDDINYKERDCDLYNVVKSFL